MKYQILGVALSLDLSSAAQGWAQTDTTETEQTTADDEFPVAGETATDEPQEGDGYLKSQHEKWEVRCIKALEGQEDLCRIYNLLIDEDGASVAEFNLTALPKGGKAAAGVDIATPLGSLLTKQVLLRIDSGQTNRYPYTWCDQLACYARFGLTGAEVDALKRGLNAQVTVWSVAAPEEPIVLNISLKGFTASWNEIAPE